ncbi:MAG: hypothetical protein LBG24_08410 [Treponema sp.]|nr:hypothetical protein [Treponema sp.]
MSRKGNTIYAWQWIWPLNGEIIISGLVGWLKSAKILATGKVLPFTQERYRIIIFRYLSSAISKCFPSTLIHPESSWFLRENNMNERKLWVKFSTDGRGLMPYVHFFPLSPKSNSITSFFRLVKNDLYKALNFFLERQFKSEVRIFALKKPREASDSLKPYEDDY